MKTLSIRFHTYVVAAICLLLSLQLSAQSPSLRSTVDRSTISVDEVLMLTVRYSGPRPQRAPSFAQLNTQFDIISTQQNSRRLINNGRISSYTEWTLTLSPKQAGQLIIPSFRLGSLISDAIEVTVVPEKKLPAGTVKDIFMENVVEKSSMYVQEQLTLKYRLFFSVNVYGVSAQELEIDNVVIDTLPHERYQRRINGKTYEVVEYNFALFPQVSGKIIIPSLQWKIKSQKNRFSREKSNTINTDAHNITVLPRPATFPVDHVWFPAENLSLEESWSGDTSEMNTGEPLTRVITLKVKGLMSSQLPPIWQQSSNIELKIYTDKPQLSDEKSTDGFTATRIESSAVVLTSAGSITIPAVRIPWWNTQSNSLQWAVIPERVITASGASSIIDELDNVERAELKDQIHFWRMLTLGLVGILIALSGYLLHRLKTPFNPAFKPEQKAYSDGTNLKKAYSLLGASLLQAKSRPEAAKEIREALLLWAKLYWQATPPKTLQDIIRLIDDKDIAAEIVKLDASLYAQTSAEHVDGHKLATLLKAFTATRQSQMRSTDIQGLYGT